MTIQFKLLRIAEKLASQKKKWTNGSWVISFWVLVLSSTTSSTAQNEVVVMEPSYPKHFISVNPLNCFVFQQVGLTYEYKPKQFGFELTVGYLYPNFEEYSNFFLAGPTGYASFGDYSGLFVIPQLNWYFKKPQRSDFFSLFYWALKPTYRYMRIDSTNWTRWIQIDYGIYDVRKMIDNTHVYGGFIDIGYKLYVKHVFIDINFGFGALFVDHHMVISRKTISTRKMNSAPGYNPPLVQKFQDRGYTVNFTINIGGGF